MVSLVSGEGSFSANVLAEALGTSEITEAATLAILRRVRPSHMRAVLRGLLIGPRVKNKTSFADFMESLRIEMVYVLDALEVDGRTTVVPLLQALKDELKLVVRNDRPDNIRPKDSVSCCMSDSVSAESSVEFNVDENRGAGPEAAERDVQRGRAVHWIYAPKLCAPSRYRVFNCSSTFGMITVPASR